MRAILIAILTLAFTPFEIQEVPQEEIKPIETSIEPIISDTEVDLMAKTVAAESINQGYLGQRLVAGVILSRVDADEFPDTITEVITQDGQFESYPEAVAKAEPNEETYKAVFDEILDRTYRYKYFRTDYPHREPFYQYRDHYFNK